MINIALSLLVALAVFLIGLPLKISAWLTVPAGLLGAFIMFIFLARKIQMELANLQAQAQKHFADPKMDQNKKLDKAIKVLSTGFAYKHRHIFVGAQLHSQIGSFYYLKKDFDNAMEHLQKGFYKNFMGQCMMAAIYYQRKEYDTMKKTMEDTIATNKKESFPYAVFAWFLYQLKEKDRAMEVLGKGLAKISNDEKLATNLNQLQNNKKMKMKAYGDLWIQMMLERPPRMQQDQPHHMRMSRKAMFRGR